MADAAIKLAQVDEEVRERRLFQRAVLLVWGLSLVLSLGFILWLSPPTMWDPEEYRELAESILKDGTFPSALRSPGYPAFVAGVQWLFGESPVPVRIVQAILLSTIVFVTVRLGLDLFGWKHRWLCLLASAAVVLNPETAYMSSLLLSDVLMMAIMPLIVLACVRTIEVDWRYGFLVGLTLVVTAYIRSEQVLLPVFLLCTAAIFHVNRKRIFAGGAVAACILLIGVSPWLIHCRVNRGYSGMNCALNANLFQRGWYLSLQGSAEPELRKLLMEREETPTTYSYAPVRRLVSDTLTDGKKFGQEHFAYRTLDVRKEAELYRRLASIGKENIPRHWKPYLRDATRAYCVMWTGFDLDWLWPANNRPTFKVLMTKREFAGIAVRLLSRIVWPIAMGLSLTAGVFFLLKQRHRSAFLCISLLFWIAVCLLPAAFLSNPSIRYRLPYDGILYLIGFFGLSQILRIIHDRHLRRSGLHHQCVV